MINGAQLPPWLAMVMGLAGCAMEPPPYAPPAAVPDHAGAADRVVYLSDGLVATEQIAALEVGR